MSSLCFLKDSSLITVIGGKELLYAAQGIMNRTYEPMFPLLAWPRPIWCWSCCSARCLQNLRGGWRKVIDVKRTAEELWRPAGAQGRGPDHQQGRLRCAGRPSGCGKSTFLRCLNRLEEPDGGHVIFNGKEVTDHDIDHVRQKMGMVFQHFNLFPT